VELTLSASRQSPEWLSERRRSTRWFLDIPASVLILLVTLPSLGVIALLVKAHSPGPVLIWQVRAGQYGKPFRMAKFRTMYHGAHEARARLADHSHAGKHLFKIPDDPRVTPLGRILRRLSLDELPQLVNVLRGEMSLVGPRPLLIEDSDYEGAARDRLLVRPGLTGLWQVSGRSDLPWEEMVRLDLHYVANRSLQLDVIILARTLVAVATTRGAY
jgi:lipopolysaccharide/colanic/teichoic acid biosynthesis glycosyltransferase